MGSAANIALSFVLFLHYVCSSSLHHDTIVVGMGAAGITAASNLAKAGKSVLALEAKTRIGGRIKSVKVGDEHAVGNKFFTELLVCPLNTYNNGPGWPTLDIKFNKEVAHIKWPKYSGNVEVVCTDGDVYTAENVIVTLSLGVLKERHYDLFSPSLPREKITAIEKMPFGGIVKIVLTFDEQWLPNGRYYGFVWKGKDKDDLRQEDNWITKIITCSTPMGARKALTCYSRSEVAKNIESLLEEVVKSKLVKLQRKFMGKSVSIPEPRKIIISSFFSDPHIRGCLSYDDAFIYEFPKARDILGEPLVDMWGNPRVMFAGEATSFNHYAIVNDASETGEREAMRVLERS